MQVYIEYVIIDNLIIDYLLISLSLRVANVKTNKLRLILSSLLGTIVAVIIPLLNIDNLYMFLIKIFLAVLMCYVAGSYISVKKYLITLASFFAFTFLSGGVIIAIFYFADVDYYRGYNFNYDSIFPIGFTILIIYILYLLYTLSFKKIVHKIIHNFPGNLSFSGLILPVENVNDNFPEQFI